MRYTLSITKYNYLYNSHSLLIKLSFKLTTTRLSRYWLLLIWLTLSTMQISTLCTTSLLLSLMAFDNSVLSVIKHKKSNSITNSTNHSTAIELLYQLLSFYLSISIQSNKTLCVHTREMTSDQIQILPFWRLFSMKKCNRIANDILLILLILTLSFKQFF